jgi:glycosyltransferase involved in cell wall biosynthesis
LLSILIPIYNQAVSGLVQELSLQARNLSCPFEILCYDDASPDAAIRQANQELHLIPGVTYKQLPHNLGRSAIRNLLAKEATGMYLLFLDCDAAIHTPDFLAKYVNTAHSGIVCCGGRVYQAQPASAAYTLHWTYGTYREAQPTSVRSQQPHKSFMFNNVFIDKALYSSILLDEQITTYGHEDSKFGFELAQRNIPVQHINNPVVHTGLDTNGEFLKKTEQGVYNLCRLYKQDGLGKDTSLIKAWKKLNSLHAVHLFCMLYDRMAGTVTKNLLSESPRLVYLDLYKLRIFCQAMQSNT